MPDGGAAELMEPPVHSVELPQETPEIEIPPQSFTPLRGSPTEDPEEVARLREEFDGIMAANKIQIPAEPIQRHQEPQGKQKRSFLEFMAKHKFLSLALSPILMIVLALTRGLKGERSGGGGH